MELCPVIVRQNEWSVLLDKVLSTWGLTGLVDFQPSRFSNKPNPQGRKDVKPCQKGKAVLDSCRHVNLITSPPCKVYFHWSIALSLVLELGPSGMGLPYISS